ncbi:MAG: class I SAM-dependent methyltransferase [Dehalococcoidales bacterium]|nr:class I SAM-dependent methyltransferase [Dehalococcoidales bacterium]
MIRFGEGLRLSYLASKVTNGVIVEIGSFKGKSTCFLAAGSRHGKNIPVYAVDTWDLRQQYGQQKYQAKETLEAFHQQTQLYGNLITAIRGFSCDVAKTWDKDIGLLFIDGCHWYKEAWGDYQNWQKFIPIGGMIALHDYHNPKIQMVVERIKSWEQWAEWEVYGRLISAQRIAK